MYKIILVDDEKEILEDRSKILKNMGYECYTAENGHKCLDILKKRDPDLILTDMKMPELNGFDILKMSREIDPTIPVIIFTGYGDVPSAVRAMKLGAFDFLPKPLSVEMMEFVIKKAIEHRRLKKENFALKSSIKMSSELENFIGKSNSISDIVQKVMKVAPSEANILIYGESGTGKEVIAKSIHKYSMRNKGPFIPLDCVSIPAQLLESEMFGHEKGAFTGAEKTKPGVLELAHNGTLFLDEIVELDPRLQAKLLRVLQERKFRRIGGTELLNVNIRIVSATNKDPLKAVKQKLFRQDLYYRLKVVQLTISPLRERKEDIPLLVNHFINVFNPTFPYEIKGISNEAIKFLKNYDWPGNVRELKNVIERAMALADSEILKLDNLPTELEEDIPIDDESLEELNFKEAKQIFLNKFSKRYIERLLDKYNGNISKTAKSAGISRWTVYRIIEKK